MSRLVSSAFSGLYESKMSQSAVSLLRNCIYTTLNNQQTFRIQFFLGHFILPRNILENESKNQPLEIYDLILNFF